MDYISFEHKSIRIIANKQLCLHANSSKRLSCKIKTCHPPPTSCTVVGLLKASSRIALVVSIKYSWGKNCPGKNTVFFFAFFFLFTTHNCSAGKWNRQPVGKWLIDTACHFQGMGCGWRLIALVPSFAILSAATKNQFLRRFLLQGSIPARRNRIWEWVVSRRKKIRSMPPSFCFPLEFSRNLCWTSESPSGRIQLVDK